MKANEKYKDFFQEKFKMYKEAFPEMSSQLIIKLSIASLDEDLDMFQDCVDYDLDMFLRFVEGLDVSLEAQKEADEREADNNDELDEEAPNNAVLNQNHLEQFVDLVTKAINNSNLLL